MGAINYSQINAKRVYAIESEDFSEDFNAIDFIRDRFPFNKDWSEGCDGWTPETWKRRNTAIKIAQKSVFIEEIGIELSLNIYAVPGYYDGATIEYDIITRNLWIDRALSEYDRPTAEKDLTADIKDDEVLSEKSSIILLDNISALANEGEEICTKLALAIYAKPGWVMTKIA